MNAYGGSAQRSMAPSLVGDDTPQRVGRFDLVTRLGAGGMANVFLARHQGAAGFERLAAIKLLHRHLSSDEQFVQMFFDEARVAARIHHPNVVPILEIGTEHDQMYMVMDYVEGDTLAAVQRAAINVRRAIPAGIVLRIILDALSGLDNAHDLRGPDGAPLNVVHRDISPQNILVGLDGVARVVDFGIARAERRLALTSVGTLKGKAPFMAPEQLEGRAVDRRADVFSMAVTMWESFALRRLYPQRNDVETVSRANRVAYRPLRAMLSQLPVEVDAIIERALAFDAEDRYASAAEFAEAIEDQLRGVIATHRQVATFMQAVASEKVAAEREAVRARASTPTVHTALKHRYDSGVHQSGRGRPPAGMDVPPPPAMPDLTGLPELPPVPRGGVLPDLPDLDVATSVSHLTDSIAPRMNKSPVQAVKNGGARRPAPVTRDALVEPEPLSVRPTGGGVAVVKSRAVGQGTPQARPSAATRVTAPMGLQVEAAAANRMAAAVEAAPRRRVPPPPPKPAGVEHDIADAMRSLDPDEVNPLEDQLETISSVRRTPGPTRQGTPAWGSGPPSTRAPASDAFTRDRTPRGSATSAPTPAMGSILPPGGVTRVGGQPGGAGSTGRHVAQSEQTGRLQPQRPQAPTPSPRPPSDADATNRLEALRPVALDLDGPEPAVQGPSPDGPPEKRLPSTFMAPPESSHASALTNAAALASVLTVAGILWLVLR